MFEFVQRLWISCVRTVHGREFLAEMFATFMLVVRLFVRAFLNCEYFNWVHIDLSVVWGKLQYGGGTCKYSFVLRFMDGKEG